MGITLMVMAILSIMVLSTSTETMANSVDRRNVFGCNTISKNILATQKDANGRECRGYITIKECKGYCFSFSIPDFDFPYKKDYHPVCSHDPRVEKEEFLTDCDEGVLPTTNRYKYLDAGGCKCSICDSSETSCEEPRKRGKPSSPAIQDSDVDVDIVRPPAETGGWRWPQFVSQILQPPVHP